MGYSISLPRDSDVNTSMYTHPLFLYARKFVCAILLGACELALHFENDKLRHCQAEEKLTIILSIPTSVGAN